MKATFRVGLTVLATVLICAAKASAVVSPEAKCEAGKNQESGKYASCLHKAEAKLLKTEGVCFITTTTDCYRDEECPMGETCSKDTTKHDEAVTKCENKLAEKWNKLETKATEAMATCPDGLLQADVKQVIDECVSNVASGLAGDGLEACEGDIATCTTDLGTCTGNLATCDSTLATCQAGLNDCQNPACGDNQSDLGEQCDGTDLNGATCASLGFIGGTLACWGCLFDTTGCTLPVETCGDGDVIFLENCDQGDLNGGTCIGEGFAGGTLACGANCSYDISGCYAARFVDNGDGTISDYETGLMWEKKSDDGTIHDKDNVYTWSAMSTNPDGTAYTTFLATLSGFAGHTGWRLPTREELQSIVDYADTTSPVVDAVFHTGCTSSCTVTSCSCTVSGFYWSSSSSAINPVGAWNVYFDGGLLFPNNKTNDAYVRAVRTGL